MIRRKQNICSQFGIFYQMTKGAKPAAFGFWSISGQVGVQVRVGVRFNACCYGNRGASNF